MAKQDLKLQISLLFPNQVNTVLSVIEHVQVIRFILDCNTKLAVTKELLGTHSVGRYTMH